METEEPPLSPTPAEQWLARIVRPDVQPTDLVLDWVLVRVVFFDYRPDRRR